MAPLPMPTSPTDTTPTLPGFDDLSPDLQYQLLRRWQRRDWVVTIVASFTSATMLAAMAVPPLNAIADAGLQTLLHGGTIRDGVGGLGNQDGIGGDFAAPVQKGDRIANYPVTSGYGPRDTTTLPAGASEHHQGVDLATPLGTKLYAPGKPSSKVKVECWQDANGGGLVANIESPDTPALSFQALHLADCSTGFVAGGKSFATTGDSGIGSAHLDWRQRDRATKEHQHPQKHYLLWALTGTAPQATLSDVDILRNAIIGQESGWESGIVNEDSGALGLGQVMPENLAPVDANGQEIPRAGWDYEALGQDLTPEEFLKNPDKQIKVINYQLNALYQQQHDAGFSEDDAIKRTAAVWYSGDADLVNDTTPQHWEGDPSKAYPSVAAYSEAVLERVKKLRS